MKLVMIMEVEKAILDRRSIRKYKKEEVDMFVLREGIRMATLAPSAHNRQPWLFKIVSSLEKDQIACLLEEKTKDIPGHTGPHTASIIREVPHLILVFIDNQKKEDWDMDMLSIGAALENMILYFTDQGLGTLWIGNTNCIQREIQELLHVSYVPVSCIGVGYKNQDPHARPRKNIEDVFLP